MPKIWRKDNFPGGADGKECACNADLGSVPGSGRSPGELNDTPLFLAVESYGQSNLVGHSPQGCRVRHDWGT